MADVPEPLWTTKEAAAFLRMEVSSFQNLMQRGDGPPSYQPTGRAGRHYFVPAEVMDWVKDHPAGGRAAVA